jgi:hypothetical protein
MGISDIGYNWEQYQLFVTLIFPWIDFTGGQNGEKISANNLYDSTYLAAFGRRNELCSGRRKARYAGLGFR